MRSGSNRNLKRKNTQKTLILVQTIVCTTSDNVIINMSSQFEDVTVNELYYYMTSFMSGKMNQMLHCDWLTERARWH